MTDAPSLPTRGADTDIAAPQELESDAQFRTLTVAIENWG
jgi:hypothetical protein